MKEWEAYCVIEPFGGDIEDYRAGLAAMLLHNTNIGKDGKPIGPLHYYPHHNPDLIPKPAPPLTPEQIAAQIDAKIFNLKPKAKTG